MIENEDQNSVSSSLPGATFLSLSGIAAAFGAASCCALPTLFATVGISSAWMAGIGSLALPHHDLLLVLGAIGLAGGAFQLVQMQRRALRCGGKSVGVPRWLLVVFLFGLVSGAALLYLGYAYV
ncbi:MAG: mercuric reductase [Alphaproteobacteria bacterium]|nr:mercuric reductase [Alphaproteobacteria bacterium]MDE2340807.1 mercuric reductase [Alphaproteobacteria bacterium]